MKFQDLVEQEKQTGRASNGQFNSMHEIYGVLMEEVDEFFDWVKLKPEQREAEGVLKELVQIASVAQTAAEDLQLVECLPATGSPLWKDRYFQLVDAVNQLLENTEQADIKRLQANSNRQYESKNTDLIPLVCHRALLNAVAEEINKYAN